MLDLRKHQIAAAQVAEALDRWLTGLTADVADAQAAQDARAAGTTRSTMDEFNRQATERQREGNAMLEGRLVEVRNEITGMIAHQNESIVAQVQAEWMKARGSMEGMISVSEARTEEKIAAAVRSVLEQLPAKPEGGD